MDQATWWAVITGLSVLLIFSLRPLLMWLASYIHWKRARKSAGSGRTPPQP